MAQATLTQRRDGSGWHSAVNARLVALLLPGILLAGAFGSELIGGLVPCEICWWQRYPHITAIVLAALAFTGPAQSGRSRLLTALAAAAIAISGLIGVYHAGVELKIFEGVTTCSSFAAGASTDELLKSILNAPLVRCDQVQWSFLGISMAGWNAIISLAGAALIAVLLRKEKIA